MRAITNSRVGGLISILLILEKYELILKNYPLNSLFKCLIEVHIGGFGFRILACWKPKFDFYKHKVVIFTKISLKVMTATYGLTSKIPRCTSV